MTESRNLSELGELVDIPQEQKVADSFRSRGESLIKYNEPDSYGYKKPYSVPVGIELSTDVAENAPDNIRQNFAGYVVFGKQVYSLNKVSAANGDPKTGESFFVFSRFNAMPTKDRRAIPTFVLKPGTAVSLSDDGVNANLHISENGELRIACDPTDEPTYISPNALKAAANNERQDMAVCVDPRMWAAKSRDMAAKIVEYEGSALEFKNSSNLLLPEYLQKIAIQLMHQLQEGKSPEDAAVIQSIILDGHVGDIVTNLPDVLQRNGSVVLRSRMKLATLYADNPETASAIIASDTVGYHGTRSSALAGILESGEVKSARSIRKSGGGMMTGEHIFQHASGQDSISFSSMDSLDSAFSYGGVSFQGDAVRTKDYEGTTGLVGSIEADITRIQSEIEVSRAKGARDSFIAKLEAVIADKKAALETIRDNPNGIHAELAMSDFPVIIGVDREQVDQLARTKNDKVNTGHSVWYGSSELSEFQLFTEGIDKMHVSVLMVPRTKVAMVSELCQKYGFDRTQVLTLEDFRSLAEN